MQRRAFALAALLMAAASVGAAGSFVLGADDSSAGVRTAADGSAAVETAATDAGANDNADGDTDDNADDDAKGGTDPPSDRTSSVPPDNPWRSAVVVVGINNSVNDSRSFEPHVRRALDYWAGEGTEHGDYEVTFVLEPAAADPDVEVRFVASIPHCGVEDDGGGDGTTLGCAPVLNEGTRATPPEVVRIAGGYNDTSTVRVLRHEFGHLLGIEHGEPPFPVMNESFDASRLPEPNASDRRRPWKPDALRLYVDAANHSADRDALAEQARGALSYYEQGAEGTLETNVTFGLVENRSAANVVVTFPESLDCENEAGSCAQTYGVDTDNDGAIEYYTRLRIQIVGIDAEAVGWHVGANLATIFGLDGEETPPAFVDAGYEDRRREWWT
ncbi:hypothetical protein [Halomarina pelagica]|uniref:hypothetical protein n=1 Tax=Halomarina pelagica TaxID=2961599 RepID=UPI0020C2C817|nr:hypothetical protein [Halomarina sp. BND7]